MASTPHSSKDFRLPPGVSFERTRLPDGTWAYVFRHEALGQLGRIVLQGIDAERCHVSCEVAGEPDDPQTEKGAALFEPLGLDLARRLQEATGTTGGSGPYEPPPPQQPSEPEKLVQSKLLVCPQCGEKVALLNLRARSVRSRRPQ